MYKSNAFHDRKKKKFDEFSMVVTYQGVSEESNCALFLMDDTSSIVSMNSKQICFVSLTPPSGSTIA